jgi:hypothetical protein
VPLSNLSPKGFGFDHRSIAILYHQVPNPNITIRNVCIAVPEQTSPVTVSPEASSPVKSSVTTVNWTGCGPQRTEMKYEPATNSQAFMLTLHTHITTHQ